MSKDPLIDLASDVIRLAVRDFRHGPTHADPRYAAAAKRDYESARAFLDYLGLLDRVDQLASMRSSSPHAKSRQAA